MEELEGLVYLNPSNYQPDEPFAGWETADAYLSGDVREKFEQARLGNRMYAGLFSRQVEALERVQPKPLEATEISLQLGAAWLDPSYIDQFLYEFLETPTQMCGDSPKHLHVIYERHNGSWCIHNQCLDQNNVTATKSALRLSTLKTEYEDSATGWRTS